MHTAPPTRSAAAIHWIVPGALDTKTGGYIYDRHVVQQLSTLGHSIVLYECAAAMPTTEARGDLALSQILATIAPDTTVVIDGLAAGAHPLALEAHAARLRLIVLVHHPLAAETGLTEIQRQHFAATEQRSLAAARRVVCTSEHTAATLRTTFGVPPDRLYVVHPGVDPVPARAARRAPKPPWRLLCVATVSVRKGHELLLQALAPWAAFPWTLRCVGSLEHDRSQAQRVRQQVHALALDARVVLLGEVDDERLRQELHAAHLFVSASHHEGFGMAVAEAVAWGLPVIATGAGAVGEASIGGAAELIAPGDAAALEAALGRFFSHDAHRTALFQRAEQRLDPPPSWAHVGKQFAQALGIN